MKKNINEEIFELAMQGLTDRQIADILYSDEGRINVIIKSLSDPLNPNYNLNMYNQILMEKALNNKAIVDKDLIDKVIQMILDGYMPIEIVVLNDINKKIFDRIIKDIKIYYDSKTYLKIKECISKWTLVDFDIIYRRILKLENKYPNIKIEDYGFDLIRYRSWKNHYYLIEDFLYNGLSLEALSIKYDVSINTVRNILLDKDSSNFISKHFDKEVCQKVRELYNSKTNLYKFNDLEKEKIFESDKCKIDNICLNSVFWISVLLTFRISINDLANMFHITNSDLLHSKLFGLASNLGDKYVNALNYLDANGNSKNIPKVSKFYKEYLYAKKFDLNKAKEMIREISDTDYINLIKSKKRINQMTEEEHQIIAKYWVKYALSEKKLTYKRESLLKYCFPYEEDEIKKIKDYHTSLYLKRKFTFYK